MTSNKDEFELKMIEEYHPLMEFKDDDIPRDSVPFSGIPAYSASRIDEQIDSMIGGDSENSRIFHVND